RPPWFMHWGAVRPGARVRKMQALDRFQCIAYNALQRMLVTSAFSRELSRSVGDEISGVAP
ncbi:MAG TPA: hypothetical protein VNL16_00375, partial [Chloroflexota bacterium]|nr:hypothetical protein [Chloroflexota bacterium]